MNRIVFVSLIATLFSSAAWADLECQNGVGAVLTFRVPEDILQENLELVKFGNNSLKLTYYGVRYHLTTTKRERRLILVAQNDSGDLNYGFYNCVEKQRNQ